MEISPNPEGRRLSISEAALYAGISPVTLRRYIASSRGPSVQRVGRRVLISVANLEAWLSSEPGSAPRSGREAVA